MTTPERSPRFDDDTPDQAAMRDWMFDDAEVRLGRPLKAAERHIDIPGTVQALETAKKKLTAAIETEKRRAIRRYARTGVRPAVDVTPEMRQILTGLFDRGQREARAEIRAAGKKPHEPDDELLAERDEPRLLDLLGRLQVYLGRIGIRIEREGAITQGLGSLGVEGLVRELGRRVPGALDTASRVVSSALDAGIGAVYEQNDDLFDGWAYTAVLDGATCDECDALDGTEYDSWAAIQEVLPDGGPNPECYGNGRCRCRAVPLTS